MCVCVCVCVYYNSFVVIYLKFWEWCEYLAFIRNIYGVTFLIGDWCKQGT
jgi:hypothetical protein